MKNKKYDELIDRFVLEVVVSDYIEYLEHHLGRDALAITQFKKNSKGMSSVWVRLPRWGRPSLARVNKFKDALLDQFCFFHAYQARYNDGSMPVVRMIDTTLEPMGNPIRARKKIIDSF